jgi:putative transposase
MSQFINKAYKFRFYPQEELKVILAKTFGCVRFVYNQTLVFSEKHYYQKDKVENYKHLTGTDRVNFVTQFKNTIETDIDNSNYGKLKYPWLNEVSSIALQQSARHLNEAYSRFFKGLGSKPQFKSKRDNYHSFTITGKGSLHFDKDFNVKGKSGFKKFYLPKYDKPLKIKFSREFNHLAVSSVTISKNPSGQYFISFLVQENIESKQATNKKLSIDLGIKTHAKVYNGKVNAEGKLEFTDYNLPELLADIDKKLRKQQRILSRKEKDSNNRNKQRIKVAKLHQKRSNIIQDFYQKLSTSIINENQEIVTEDLNIAGMKKNRKLSSKIHDVAWKRLISMIEYKAKWNDRVLTKANRFYPSSKTCSHCGHIYHGLSLKERTWTCTNCNAHHDRDENACLNLYYYDKTTVGTTVNACGGKKNYLKSNDLGRNVRPKTSKLNSTKKSKAISKETGIIVL